MSKESNSSTAARRAPEAASPQNDDSGFVSRKLIRPTLSRRDVDSAGNGTSTAPAPSNTDSRRDRPKKTPALEQTHAETFYFQKQVQSKTLMTFILKNGEEIQGCIDWFDKTCIRITRTGKPNLLLYKGGIRFMYKSGENTAGR